MKCELWKLEFIPYLIVDIILNARMEIKNKSDTDTTAAAVVERFWG